MKSFVLVLSVIIVLAATQLDVAAQKRKNNLSHCGSVVMGLRLCVETLDISVKSFQSVSLQLWIENTTKKEIPIQKGNFFKYLYKVKITDQKGSQLPSFYEIAEEKQKNGTVSAEESAKLLRLCCFGSLPSQQVIAPGEKKLLNVDLNDVFKFSPKPFT